MEYKITNSCHRGVPTHINQGSNELLKVLHSGWVPGSPLCSSTPQPNILSDKDGHFYLRDGAKLTLYADDVLLFRTINSSDDFVALQEDIDKVASWSCTNFLALNRDKCKYMVVSRRRTASTPLQPLLLDNHPLDQVKMFKYLGVLMSHDLSWGEHVQSVCSRARKILVLLYR